MAGLLVSVRSVVEAEAAVLGGATVIDIKEPNRGPLGRADGSVWRAIRAAVPAVIPVSVALGELVELVPGSIQTADLVGISFQKAGPAGSARAWPNLWDQVRSNHVAATAWVAVIYADWILAAAPEPDQVIATALRTDDCAGLLIDTWNKHQPSPLEASKLWLDRVQQIQQSGRFVALAGRLDRAAIRRLQPLEPDLFAVRGAACTGGDRQLGQIDAGRVAQLVAELEAGPKRGVLIR